MRISLDLSNADFVEMATGIPHLRSQFLNEAAELITARARAVHHFHSESGDLERSIKHQIMDDHVDIYLDEAIAPHSIFVHEGTGLWGPRRRSFKIMPRGSGKALFFEGRFAKSVRERGIHPDQFMNEAFDNSRENVLALFDRDFDAYIGVG